MQHTIAWSTSLQIQSKRSQATTLESIIEKLESSKLKCPCKEWEKCLNAIEQCKDGQGDRGCAHCPDCVLRLMLSLIFIICSSINTDQNTCGRLGALFKAKTELYQHPEAIAKLEVEQLACDLLDAGLPIYAKNATYIVPMMSFI